MSQVQNNPMAPQLRISSLFSSTPWDRFNNFLRGVTNKETLYSMLPVPGILERQGLAPLPKGAELPPALVWSFWSDFFLSPYPLPPSLSPAQRPVQQLGLNQTGEILQPSLQSDKNKIKQNKWKKRRNKKEKGCADPRVKGRKGWKGWTKSTAPLLQCGKAGSCFNTCQGSLVQAFHWHHVWQKLARGLGKGVSC